MLLFAFSRILAAWLIIFCLGFSGYVVGFGSPLLANDEVSFALEVRPILSNHCFACHGPDETHREADLRLDVASDWDAEELLRRITSTDADEVMPPPKTNKPLGSEQIETLRRWIETGATYGQHWAFEPVVAQSVPRTSDTSWSDQPIDRFVLAKLEQQGWTPNPPADPRTLLRRATLDLTGLPPTREQIDQFLSDESDHAYENLIDRLMNRPAYGEHMARYWLDLVRFADSNGRHHDHYRDMTPYRDWVIRSFNENLPMDDFITYQLAGDVFDNPTDDQLIASGFNRLHLIIDVGTALPEESFFLNVVDRVSAVGTTFLGLSLQCAVCHDHKYDPITMRDFYQLSAFFNNLDAKPETGSRSGADFFRGLQKPYIDLPSPDQHRELQRIGFEIESVKEQLNEQKRLQDDAKLAELKAELKTLNQRRDDLLMEVPAAMVMKERDDIRPAHIMIRGAYDQPGEQVGRDVPSFLPPLEENERNPTRMDLANWMTDRSNPLTARVAVNRFWQQFFGVGLVKTSEDFGSQGESPSHPKLLDHLAIEFMKSGWDVKALVRSIVLSQTYRQSSAATPQQYQVDAENRLLARGSRYRLDAEVIRDQVLATTGLLNTTLYGKSVKPPQPAGLWKIVLMPTSYPKEYVPDAGEKTVRRSIYTYWRRGLPPPQMTIFDAPTRESCIARRERTNTPLQALTLMNETQYFSAAMHYARSLLNQREQADRQLIERAYEDVTSRLPSSETLRRLENALDQFRLLYSNDTAAAEAMVQANQRADAAPISDPKEQASVAAWTMLVHSLLNLDVTKTKE